jgi:hypothetical protein
MTVSNLPSTAWRSRFDSADIGRIGALDWIEDP